MMKPEIIADYQCHNAEVPLWHKREKCLYWTDIPRGRMYRYHPGTKKSEQIYEGSPVGGYTIQDDGALLLLKAGGKILRWDDGKMTLIAEIPDESESRFNDAIADPQGRVFCGTMPTPERLGRLYRLNTDATLTSVLDGIGCSNGMGFTPNRQQMYYTDSTVGQIYLFDYDAASGNLSNQRVHLTIPKKEGLPDGLTVDAEGFLWSARWNGGHLFRYNTLGEEVLRVPFPAKKVTSLTFGGEDYTDMFITTAGGDNRAEEGAGAGAIFHLNLGIQGVPEFSSRIGF
ncbi:SMP-30/gluconolactonase/LRE family protein [Oscillatoria salina IIICB1]|nr:SMP-30/gluconolactonase/LRE family protein [Oscillatoria salina IIICB1]NET89363.1 SMP-30/gluconolactonase/LRE family protein [Kamptonema sp. SIO1D9]